MSELPEDPKLTSFLHQHRSIAQPEILELEDRLMSEIDLLPIEKQYRISHSWQQYIIFGIVLIVTGITGAAVFQIFNPPESSIAELNQLDLFLEAYAPNTANYSELNSTNQEDLVELDPDLF